MKLKDYEKSYRDFISTTCEICEDEDCCMHGGMEKMCIPSPEDAYEDAGDRELHSRRDEHV